MECMGHSHDHDHEDEPGHSLHDLIDVPQVWCLNEEIRDSGKKILKSYENRFENNPSLCSQPPFDEDEEPELLLYVPFTEAVSIKHICVRGYVDNIDNSIRNNSVRRPTADPKSVKLFVDRDDLDFESARELPPAMKIELVPPGHDDGSGTIDYPLRPAGRFQNINSITLYFNENYSGEEENCQTEITYVGFKGKGTKMKRRAVQAVYETKGMLKDHKVPDDAMGSTANNLF